MTFCIFCGIDQKAMRNNHCLADLRENAPEMIATMSNTIKILNPVHSFIAMGGGLPQIYGKGVIGPDAS